MKRKNGFVIRKQESNPVNPLIRIVRDYLAGVKNRVDMPNKTFGIFLYKQSKSRKILSGT